MDFYFLPKEYQFSLNKLEVEKLTEIRLREGQPVIIRYNFKRLYLTNLGADFDIKNALICNREIIEEIIEKITEYSMYAFNEEIINGYITTKDGIRVGICGECVFKENKIICIKNFNSLNIRIPHLINNCSSKIFNILKENNFSNSLIISPPAYGKTTILKDITKNISLENNFSVLIVDERGEFNCLKLENVDKISYSNKEYAFEVGIRAMSPDIIITDEIYGKKDWLILNDAVKCGVKIIASCHAVSIEEIIRKDGFNKEIFNNYFILDNNGQVGKLKKYIKKEDLSF